MHNIFSNMSFFQMGSGEPEFLVMGLIGIFFSLSCRLYVHQSVPCAFSSNHNDEYSKISYLWYFTVKIISSLL